MRHGAILAGMDIVRPMPAAVRVSVVVPVHDGAGPLRQSLRSILGQTFEDFEVLVSGDGAGDDVRREALATGDARVRWEGFPKAPGLGYSNRARAIGRAKGTLVAYLAPDDLWAPRHLERLIGMLDRERLDFAFSKPVLVWTDGVPRPHYFPFDRGKKGSDPRRFLLACLSPTQVLHSIEIHDRAGGWTDRFRRHGDVDLWLRCRAAGARIGFLREPTVVRFPSYVFAAAPAGSAAAIQARFAEELISGDLVLDELGWSFARRLGGWVEDVVVVGRSRGPRWARTLLARALR
jgi:glycosyltransferase involved in cell wall biosynthesis